MTKVTRQGLVALLGNQGETIGAGEIQSAVEALLKEAGVAMKDLGVKTTTEVYGLFIESGAKSGRDWLSSKKPAPAGEFEIEDVAPAGPTLEDEIATARAEMDEAKKAMEGASKSMKGAFEKIYLEKRAVYDALVGTSEEAGERVEIEFEDLIAGELPVDKYVSGPVTLTVDAAKMLLHGPAWITDAGKRRAMCDPACGTGKGIVFFRVYGADQAQYLPRVLNAGKVLKITVMPADEKHAEGGKVAALFIGDYENGEEPSEARVLDVSKDGDWFKVGPALKRGGGKLGGATTTGKATGGGGRLGGK